MAVLKDKEVNKKDTLYYARIMPNLGIYDLCEVKVRTVADDYFTAIDKHDKHVFLFNYEDIDKVLFRDREIALNRVLGAEKNRRIKVSDETYYEEY